MGNGGARHLLGKKWFEKRHQITEAEVKRDWEMESEDLSD